MDAYVLYLISFIPIVIFSSLLWLNIRKRLEYGRRPFYFLLALVLFALIGVIGLTARLLSISDNNGFIVLIYLLNILYFAAFFILEYSIHCQRIVKSFLLDDFKTYSKPLIPLGIVLFLYLLMAVIVSFNKGGFAWMLIDQIIPIFIFIAKLVYVMVIIAITLICNLNIFHLQENVIRQKKYPFYALLFVGLAGSLLILVGAQLSFYVPLLFYAYLNLIFIIRICQEYLFQRTAHMIDSLETQEESQKMKNNLMEKVIKSSEQEDIEYIVQTINEALRNSRKKLVVNEYSINGLVLFKREGNILKVPHPSFIQGYCSPLTESEVLRKADKTKIGSMILKDVYDLQQIKNTETSQLKNFGSRIIKEMLEKKERLVVPVPQFLQGLQRFIALYPIFDKDKEKFDGFIIAFKETFHNIFPEEENAMNDLTENLHIAFAIIEGKEIQRERNRLSGEMSIARNIQMSILPREIKMPGFECAAIMQTATEVGGDVYDFCPSRFGNYLGIGDVSGHGLPAGMMALIQMAAFHSSIKTSEILKTELSIDKIYEVVNQVLCTINRDRVGSDKFMTQNYLLEKNGQFKHSGTHEIALLYMKKENKVHEIKGLVDKTAFLGLSEDITAKDSLGQFSMEPQDVLILYSDGVIEAKNYYYKQYGIGLLAENLKKNSQKPAQEIIENILTELKDFAKDGDLKKHNGSYADDVSIVVLKKN